MTIHMIGKAPERRTLERRRRPAWPIGIEYTATATTIDTASVISAAHLCFQPHHPQQNKQHNEVAGQRRSRSIPANGRPDREPACTQ